MFSTTGLFKNIPCPEGESCNIINCIFSHELRPKISDPPSAPSLHPETKTVIETLNTNPAKKRKLEHDSEVLPSPKVAASQNLNHGSKLPASVTAGTTLAKTASPKPLQTLNKPVSPPTASKAAPPPPKPEVKETLNPRLIPYDPAGHAKRTLFLQHLHAQMKRLNDEVANGSQPDKKKLILTDNELIKAALDEEEKIARENSKVYANIIKNRIAAYKKMNVEAWVSYVLATFRVEDTSTKPNEPAPINTGLPLDQEHFVLPHLTTDQTPLAKHGYVLTPSSAEDIAEANAAVAASMNFEVCDRCRSRFRVFPDRREEDGALTTNGPCLYHWQRPIVRREKTDAIKGQKESFYPCCQEPLGTKGCTECETHVFKINEAKRLSTVLPFINTPENPSPAKGPNGKPPSAVTFDCEMGYTVSGFELIRLTAVSWPEGDPLVDVLVRTKGAILDLNSRWSGVWPDAYAAAIPYSEKAAMDSLMPPPPPGSRNLASTDTEPLAIVPSTSAARDLLCSFITPSTPLIGHALENDLNAVRLCHPTIIDTVMLYPHPRGLPLRFGLKMLVKRHLGRDIQMAGDAGHDSLEDARATGDLVRWAVKGKFEQLKREDWKMGEQGLVPPLPPGLPPLQEGERVLGGGSGVKRQRLDISGGTNKRSREE